MIRRWLVSLIRDGMVAANRAIVEEQKAEMAQLAEDYKRQVATFSDRIQTAVREATAKREEMS